MPRNPNWTRDELILALDLYFQLDPSHASADHPDVVALSSVLNRLPIHTAARREEKFRNANGVYMKLCNFLRLDPDYSGTGLDAGSKLDEEVWGEFANDQEYLRRTADAIRDSYETVDPARNQQVIEMIDEEEFAEGRVLTRLHKMRERDTRAVKHKKRKVLEETGRLACEVCGFDFQEAYGALGEGFAECHHVIPLSGLRAGTRTRLSDLAILCANCHRMIHRGEKMLSIAQLREIVAGYCWP